MQHVDATRMIDMCLHDLAFGPNATRVLEIYRDRPDNILQQMDNELRLAYNEWHWGTGALALQHLQGVRATCEQRLTPVFWGKYNTCVPLLEAEVARAAVPISLS